MLVGNKTDLVDEWQVSSSKAEEWAKENGVLEYAETSAKENSSGNNPKEVKVGDMFEKACMQILSFWKKFMPSDKEFGRKMND